MAGRGGPKLKEYRQHVTSVRHWLKEIEYEGLIVCEVYCGAFGNCANILPTINSIMLSVDDAEEKMKWLVINVAKLEEDQRHLLAEDEKKKAELESVQRRKALNEKDAEGNATSADGATSVNADGSVQTSLGSSLPLVPLDDEETSSKLKSAWDKITLPKLEKYTNYDHPRPLWVMMKDGHVVYELNAANPPKMHAMVHSILSGVPLTEKELQEMDFHPDPQSAASKRKRAKQAQAAAKKKAAMSKSPEELMAALDRHARRTASTKKSFDASGHSHKKKPSASNKSTSSRSSSTKKFASSSKKK